MNLSWTANLAGLFAHAQYLWPWCCDLQAFLLYCAYYHFLLSSKHCCIFRLTGNTTKALNLGSYNYLGFAENVGPCAEAAKEAVKNYGLAGCSTRHEYGEYFGFMLAHGGQSFVAIALQTFCLSQIGFKYVGPSARCILANFFIFAILHIAAILIKTLNPRTLGMLLNWLRHMRALTESVGVLHTS